MAKGVLLFFPTAFVICSERTNLLSFFSDKTPSLPLRQIAASYRLLAYLLTATEEGKLHSILSLCHFSVSCNDPCQENEKEE